MNQANIPAILIGEDGAPMPLARRTQLAQAAGASAFISLHHDSVQPQFLSTWTVAGQPRPYSDAFHGYSVFISNEGARPQDSQRLGAALAAAMRAAGQTPSLHHAQNIPGENRPLVDAATGLYRFDKLVVLRTATMPAALLEAGIILNRADEAELRTPAHLARLSTAIVAAVQRFCTQPQSR